VLFLEDFDRELTVAATGDWTPARILRNLTGIQVLILERLGYGRRSRISSPARSPSEVRATLRWRELDSKFRFRARFGLVFVVSLFVLRFVAEA
jgi:hypothetical protein